MDMTITIVAVLASIFLGTFSNWLYELLKEQGIFPNKFSLKALTVILFVCSPLVLLLTYSDGSYQTRRAITDILQVPIALWQCILALLFVCIVGYIWAVRREAQLSSLLTDLEHQKTNLEEHLKSYEKQLKLYTSSSGILNEESIINPR